MRQYETIEFCYTAPAPEGSEAAVNLQAEFIHERERTVVKGFYAGSQTYIVRFLPSKAGEYQYRVFGIVNASGSFFAEPAAGSHGMVQAEGRHFRYQDGTSYLPVGTTVYALVHQTEELIEETMDTLKHSPFNKIRLCVFPKNYLYNRNEPLYYPFEKNAAGQWDVHHPCFAYWDFLEKQLRRLADMGIQADLILFHPYDRWGFDSLTQEENKVYLDYLLRRLSALPGMWWSMANEYDLSPSKSLADWHELEEFTAENDPYHHLLSVHNCYAFYDYNRSAVTHVSIQVKTLARLAEWREAYPGKPVMVDECCYEGNLPAQWGCLSGREMTARFWRAYTNGAYCTHGETFLDEEKEVVWWAKGGRLKGESPARIGFLKSVFEELGPVEPVKNAYFTMLTRKGEELPEELLAELPKEQHAMYRAMFAMNEQERQRYSEYQWIYQGHVGEEAFLRYYDWRCCVEDTLELPENKEYRIEVIDTWEMTREVIQTRASGKVRIKLPGKEGIAVLARAV